MGFFLVFFLFFSPCITVQCCKYPDNVQSTLDRLPSMSIGFFNGMNVSNEIDLCGHR